MQDSTEGADDTDNFWLDEGADAHDSGSSDEEIDFDFDDSSSATEILSNLVVLRALKKSSRPVVASPLTLCSVSPIGTPLSLPYSADNQAARQTPRATSRASERMDLDSKLTDAERWMVVAANEAQETALASLYSATVCSISRRAMGGVIAKILQVLEDDVQYASKDKFQRKYNANTAVRLLCGVMCTPSGNAFLPRFMMSLAAQLQSLCEGCAAYDLQPSKWPLSFVGRLRGKLAVRLQLVAVVARAKHAALTVCYRDRIVKALFMLLKTSVVTRCAGLSLFSWILDLIPSVNASLLQDNQQVRLTETGAEGVTFCC